MALPAYSAIYTDITGGLFTPQIIVALWMAVGPILSAGTAANLANVQAFASQILQDTGLPIRVAFRILNTVLAGGTPTDASIQTAVSALIPASGPFTL